MKAYDERWNEEFDALGTFPIQNYLRYDTDNVTEEKERFLRGDVRNPTFSYPLAEKVDVKKIEDELIGLREKIENEESNKWVKVAYLDRIEEKLTELEQLKAVKENNDKLFDLSMSRLYGEIDSEVFAGVLSAFNKRLETGIKNDNRNISLASEKLSEFLHLMIDEVGVGAEKYELTYVDKEAGEYLKASGIGGVFREELRLYNVIDWEVVVDETKKFKSITVNQNEKRVYIPHSRKLTLKESKALAHHELIHIKRRLNGDSSPLKILGRGLAGYLRAEEGLAKRAELMFSNSALNATLENYLLSGLILGADGKKRDFRDIYEISLLLFEAIHIMEEKNLKRQPENFAWLRAARFFRGTSGQTAGVCQRRYKAYLEGYLKLNEMINADQVSEEVAMLGKYDPANDRHVAILEGLNMI